MKSFNLFTVSDAFWNQFYQTLIRVFYLQPVVLDSESIMYITPTPSCLFYLEVQAFKIAFLSPASQQLEILN